MMGHDHNSVTGLDTPLFSTMHRNKMICTGTMVMNIISILYMYVYTGLSTKLYFSLIHDKKLQYRQCGLFMMVYQTQKIEIHDSHASNSGSVAVYICMHLYAD